eukprot:5622214-Pyramimonas_sp.AAC.1
MRRVKSSEPLPGFDGDLSKFGGRAGRPAPSGGARPAGAPESEMPLPAGRPLPCGPSSIRSCPRGLRP